MRVLFVCTGNTCRSPMAEGLFRRIAHEAGLQIEVKSAGISAHSGSAFTDHTVKVLRERQAEFSGTSTSLTAELLAWADIILVMTMGHKQALLSHWPEYVDNVHLLKEFVSNDPQMKERQAELDRLYMEVEVKRAQFMAEHKQEIDELEQQIRDREAPSPQHEQQIQQLQRAMSELTQEEEEKIHQLEQQLPDYDIPDPIGGTLDEYRRLANELETLLSQLVDKLKDQSA